MRLVREAPLLVKQKILDKRAPVICEALIQWIFAPSTKPRLNGIDEVVTVILILDVEEPM